MEWAKNWVIDKVSGYAKTGIQAGGTLAGNAVGGVGSLIENSGRSVGQSTSGAIGGVGGYINNYGDGIKNSMAADGPVGGGGAQKKTTVKPTQAVKRTADGTQKTATKALPAVSTGTKALPAPNQTPAASSSLKPAAMPSKPPQPTNRVLPAKKPVTSSSPTITKPPAAKPAVNTASTPSTGSTPRPPVSTRQSERTPDGKVKIARSARPSEPTTNNQPTTPLARLAASNEASRPQPVRAPVSTRLSPIRGDGKVRISAESRPRPAVRAN
ncbi:hypothetical protein HII31_05008 [Pseudocercospora fuligena]|uniref:Uncharacterized protein n=1 Tax=Pseudocercospora fuligena TaxID=685502 RepID=A0A8H6VKF4_9PEZI|nr:hypothetical protein HII31_05008 [Pseudocercospora fuligena]